MYRKLREEDEALTRGEMVKQVAGGMNSVL